MKNAERFLVDTLNRIKRSIEITGTGLNYKGRKSIEYTDFEKRFLRKVEYTIGEDPNGYYGVCIYWRVDGTEVVFDASNKKAYVYEVNKKTGEKTPVIYRIADEKMIRYFNVYYRPSFGDFLCNMRGGSVKWRDYACCQ